MITRLRDFLRPTSSTSHTTGGADTLASSESFPPGSSSGPGPRDVGRLRRDRRRLLRAREVSVRDLGGLVLEMFRRDRFGPDLLERKAGDILGMEGTIREVDEALTSALAAVPAPVIGSYRTCGCGTEIPPGAKFCPGCGRSLPNKTSTRRCPACNASLSADALVCPDCGTTDDIETTPKAGW